MPLTYPLSVYRGDTYHWRFLFWDDEGKTQASDLTGVTAKAEIRNAPGGADITALACVITTPNIVDVSLTAANSKTLPPSGVWDLQLTYPSGDVHTPVAGGMTLTLDVTDSTTAGTQSPRLSRIA
jgi:hypothetical protein